MKMGTIHTKSYGIKNKEIRGFVVPYYMIPTKPINTNKSTIGQSGPMVFVYINKISWISKKIINSKKRRIAANNPSYKNGIYSRLDRINQKKHSVIRF